MFKMKRAWAVILTAVLLVMMLPTAFAENEILISTKEDLNAIRNNLSANYKLANDITFSSDDFAEGGAFYNNGALFTPIGNREKSFTGIFDGAGHKIIGLQMNTVFSEKEQEPFCGLFVSNAGTIQNVELQDVAVSAKGLALEGVTLSRFAVGAIAARNGVNGKIRRCSVTGKVTAEIAGNTIALIGGLVGENNGSIEDCRNLAEISATADIKQWLGIGGIAGYGAHNTSNIASYSTLSDVRRCYNAGKLSATGMSEDKIYMGGIIGRNQQHGIVLNCYYVNTSAPAGVYTFKDGETPPVPYDENKVLEHCSDAQISVKSFTTDALSDSATFSGFDFDAVWTMQSGMPTLQVLGEHEHIWNNGVVAVPADCTTEGTKTLTCKVCGETKTGKIPAKGHDWGSTYTVDKEPTCVENGSKSIHCSRCDQTKETTVILATGKHTWNEGKVTTAATCVNKGEKLYTCTVCNQTKTEEISATGKHTAGAWTVIKQPTSSATGISVQKCTVCGKELGRKTLAKTGDPCEKFSDVVRSAWYHKAIDYAIENNLLKGFTNTTLAPTAQMTRGMFVTILGRLNGVNAAKGATKFKDVKADAYYSGYVKWASDAGIVDGVSVDRFAPDANVTREQICKMMVNYCKYAGIQLKAVNAPVTFKDANEISGWAKSFIATCQKAGLVNGSDGKFNPKGEANRAEVAQILMNFSNNYLK